jgi:hypothetical protein
MSATLQDRLLDILNTLLAQNYFNSGNYFVNLPKALLGYCYIRIDGGSIPKILRTPYWKTYFEE